MSDEYIAPGNWLGVLGGGQLGRMFAQAAHRHGYRVAVFESDSDCPAAQVSNRFFDASPDKQLESISSMANLCAAITLEFENVDAQLVDSASQHCFTCPGAEFLRISQNRIVEKTSLSSAGFPTTPFRAATSLAEAEAGAEQLGYPVVLKTATSGYDGKGQAKVLTPAELPGAWSELKSDNIIVEKMIDFTAEVSMVTARNRRGQIVSYPLFENAHANHILDVTVCPASDKLLKTTIQAREICQGIAEKFGVEGIFCVEFFVADNGDLMINEIAPRPHNSGHLTIEAFDVSQFDLQVRATCNLPLYEPIQIMPGAMANLLGDVWGNSTPKWETALTEPRTYLHLYGKAKPKAGRKMGHVTCLAESSHQAADQAKQIRGNMQG